MKQIEELPTEKDGSPLLLSLIIWTANLVSYLLILFGGAEKWIMDEIVKDFVSCFECPCHPNKHKGWQEYSRVVWNKDAIIWTRKCIMTNDDRIFLEIDSHGSYDGFSSQAP